MHLLLGKENNMGTTIPIRNQNDIETIKEYFWKRINIGIMHCL